MPGTVLNQKPGASSSPLVPDSALYGFKFFVVVLFAVGDFHTVVRVVVDVSDGWFSQRSPMDGSLSRSLTDGCKTTSMGSPWSMQMGRVVSSPKSGRNVEVKV
ncbi:hypothetical protein L1987_74215 [Smallanthus sonchifolius]|uniref:Uncharacterized protein n=1 Tax=Smallanthus sonchifolius TaxID=185202 RepID=A0ACB9A3M9_9ASTR|nr:hypothetical protein L1987_74215 [Smallanthus sonchifolius]